MLDSYRVGLPTIIIRKAVFDAPDCQFNPKYQIVGDFDLVIRIAVRWQVVAFQKPLAVYRVHRNSETRRSKLGPICELEHWHKNMLSNRNVSTLKKFRRSAELPQYLKALYFLDSKNYREAYSIFRKLRLGRRKIKLVIAYMMPRLLRAKVFP